MTILINLVSTLLYYRNTSKKYGRIRYFPDNCVKSFSFLFSLFSFQPSQNVFCTKNHFELNKINTVFLLKIYLSSILSSSSTLNLIQLCWPYIFNESSIENPLKIIFNNPYSITHKNVLPLQVAMAACNLQASQLMNLLRVNFILFLLKAIKMS